LECWDIERRGIDPTQNGFFRFYRQDSIALSLFHHSISGVKSKACEKRFTFNTFSKS